MSMTTDWRGKDGGLRDHRGDCYDNRAYAGLKTLRTQRSEWTIGGSEVAAMVVSD